MSAIDTHYTESQHGADASVMMSQPQTEARRIAPQPCPAKAETIDLPAVNKTTAKAPQSRRVAPEPIPSAAPMPAKLGCLAGMQSRLITSQNRNADRLAGQASSQQQGSSSATASRSQTDTSGSSTSADMAAQTHTQSGPDQAGQESGEDAEDVSGVVLTEFGTRGDLWWDDFIAAKEEMLTAVLQVPHTLALPCPPRHCPALLAFLLVVVAGLLLRSCLRQLMLVQRLSLLQNNCSVAVCTSLCWLKGCKAFMKSAKNLVGWSGPVETQISTQAYLGVDHSPGLLLSEHSCLVPYSTKPIQVCINSWTAPSLQQWSGQS